MLAVSNWSLLCFSSKVLCQLYSRWYNRHDVFYKAFLICSHKDSFQHASCLTVTVLRSGWFDLTTRTFSSSVICFVVFVCYILGIWEGGWQVQYCETFLLSLARWLPRLQETLRNVKCEGFLTAMYCTVLYLYVGTWISDNNCGYQRSWLIRNNLLECSAFGLDNALMDHLSVSFLCANGINVARISYALIHR